MIMEIKSIYTDNYRGFYGTLFSLKEVNFLVGENSSGKTSLLKLISLIASSEFWFNGQFRNDDIDLSYYGDLAENFRESRTKICVVYQDHNKKNELMFAKIILQSGKNNKTSINALEIISSDISIQIKMQPDKSTVLYRVNPYSGATEERFIEWCEEPIEGDGFVKYKNKLSPYIKSSPFMLVRMVISASSKENKEDIKDIRMPQILNTFSPFSWIAPIRVKPQQTYDGNVYDYSSDGAHTPYALRDIYDRKQTKAASKLISALEDFGKDSGLFDSVKANRYSKAGNAPFTIDVVRGSEVRHITDVGYGVSQVLPIVVSILNSNYARTYQIQQPEVHLHPRAQASLGGLFFDIADSEGATFLIETHSDFIIDRFRQKLSNAKKKTAPKAKVIFFEHVGNKNTAYSIEINSDGSYSENQPDSFRKFFLNEEMKNIAI
jgi:predicted ATPase